MNVKWKGDEIHLMIFLKLNDKELFVWFKKFLQFQKNISNYRLHTVAIKEFYLYVNASHIVFSNHTIQNYDNNFANK